MAICKCGAKLGDGKVRQCKGCGRQWPCIRQSKETGGKEDLTLDKSTPAIK